MKLEDLTLEDRISLMNEMREIIEQENISKNAVTMYSIKKKELINDKIEEMCNILKFNTSDKQRLKDKYIAMINYLYTVNISPKNHYVSNGVKITNAEQWEIFVNTCKNIMECIVHTIKYKGDSHE